MHPINSLQGLHASVANNGNPVPSILVHSNREDSNGRSISSPSNISQSNGTPRNRLQYTSSPSNRTSTQRNQSVTSSKLTIKLPSSDIPSSKVSFALEQMQMVPVSNFSSNPLTNYPVNSDFAGTIERPNLPPVHRSSGEQSVSVGSDDQKKYSHHRRRQSLWNTNNSEALADVEARKKQQQEELQLLQQRQQQQQHLLLEQQRHAELLTIEAQRLDAERKDAESKLHSAPSLSNPSRIIQQQRSRTVSTASENASPTGNNFFSYGEYDEDENIEAVDTLAPLKSPKSPCKSPSKFKSKDVRKQLMQQNVLLLSQEENQEVAEIIDESLHELHNSKSRDQLHTLKKYVMGHTRRKLVGNWNMIENRFKTSSMFKTSIVRDVQKGMDVNIKQPAIFASALASVLCSSRVKLGHRELQGILLELGCTEEQIFLARQIAAHYVVIGICQEAKSDLVHVYTEDMQKLLRDEHFLVGLHDLEDLIFSSDMNERKKELETVHSNRNVEVQQMLEEKKKKEEKRDQIVAGRKKLIDEFEKILGQVQLLKAPMNIARVELFQYIVQECRTAIHDYYEEQTSKVPMDLLSFLGMEAFPPAVQDKIRLRLGKQNAPKISAANAAVQRGMVSTMTSRSNSVVKSETNLYTNMSSCSFDTQDSQSTQPSLMLLGQEHHAVIPGLGIGMDILEGLEDPLVASVTSIKLAGPASLLPANSNNNITSNNDVLSRPNTPSPRATYSPRSLAEVKRPESPIEPPLTSLALAHQVIAKSHKEQKLEVIMAKKKQQLFTPTATSSMGSIMSCLRGMVAIGKTFPGVSYRDAVEMLQYVAVTKIATIFRGFKRRWRFMRARFMWRAKFRIIAHRHFLSWANMIRDFVTLRNHCLRKIKAWRFYTKYTQQRRESFRIAFWPLYTWRKYATASRTAKEKAKFLVGRVMPTLTNMRVFRAWRDYTQRECHLMRLARKCVEEKRRLQAHQMLRFLHFWARQRKKIRSAWYRYGQTMRTKNLMRLRLQSIRIWQAFAWIRKYARERIRSEFWWIKQTLLAGKQPLKKKSLVCRRISVSPKRHAGGETAVMNQSMNKMKANMGKKSSLVGNNARKVVKPIVSSTAENDANLAKVVEECKRRKVRFFTWRPKDMKMNDYFDIDSDGEDDEDIPPMVQQLYQALYAKMQPFEQILDQPFNLSPFDAAQRIKEIRLARRQKLKRQSKLIEQQRELLNKNNNMNNKTMKGKGKNSNSSSANRSRATSANINKKNNNINNNKSGKNNAKNNNKMSGIEEKPTLNLSSLHQQLQQLAQESPELDTYKDKNDGNGNNGDDDDEEEDDEVNNAVSIFAGGRPIILSTYPPEISFIARKHYESAQRGYQIREIWNLFDAAWRFHRFAHLAFHNLRQYAKIKHRVRVFQAKRRERILNECWSAWHEIVHVARRLNKVGSSMGEFQDDGLGHMESADVLVYRIRSHHTFKVSRTRKVSEDVRLHATNIEEDEEEARKRYLQRMKNLNLIADDDDDYLEKQRQQTLQRIAENKARLANQWLHGYVPPNMLEIDRRDRLKELKLMKDMLGFGVRLKEETKQEVQASDARHEEFRQYNATLTNMVEEVLGAESQVTEQAVEKQLEYAKHFKEHAADLLITTLANVREEVMTAILKAQSKIYFRAMRLPMLISRSYQMYNRKKMRNYLRICKRLISIDRLAPFYHTMRKKWVLFNLWLQHVEKAKLHPSAGFARMLRRRLLLHPDFHKSLQEKGFLNKAYTEDDRLRAAVTEFKVIFSRWKMYTQENILFCMMHERVGKLARLKILRRYFWGLKHQLSVEDPDNYRQYLATIPSCFPMIQLQADLDQITKRFIPIRKSLLPQAIRKKNKKIIHKRKVESKDGLTFKKFLTSFSTEVSVRVSMEQRLLFEAFEERGKQTFVHRCVPESRTEDTTGLVPVIMSKLEGSSEFCDPREESVVPAGFRLAKLKFAMVIVGNTVSNPGATNHSNNNGDDGFVITSSAILGWQLLWTGEGCTEIESRQRGLWHAAGMSVQEIVVPKEDFVIGIEYMYDGAYMVALRCKFFHGGWSRWIGGKTSLSTLSVYIPCDAGIQEDFEKERLLSDDEIRSPALPYNYVMGLSGLIHNHRVTCLGLIVRKIQKQNIFSYHWVQDRLVQTRLEEGTADSGALDQLPSVTGIHSIPSEIEVDNPVLAKNALSAEEVNNNSNKVQNATILEEDSDHGDDKDNNNDRKSRHRRSLLQRTNDREGGGVVGTEERGGVDNDVIPMGESLTLSHVGEEMGFDNTFSPINALSHDENDLSVDPNRDPDNDSDSEDHDVFADDNNSITQRPGSPSSHNNHNSTSNSAITGGKGHGRAEFLRRRFLRQFQAFDEDGNMKDDILTRAEQQFFDTIRMRMTEIAAAKQRVIDFARFLWSTPTLRNDNELKKLLSLKIVSGLARWMFNALSRRLLPVCQTEKQGLKLMKQGRRMVMKSRMLNRQAGRIRDMATGLEQMRMPWTGKSLLGPTERAAKKEHMTQIAQLHQQVKDMHQEADAMFARGQELIKEGDHLLPRLPLSLTVYNNFRHKVAAARHKETLLERMSLEDIKKGLFGANMKETLLNRDQMQAIHASLKDRKIEMKDTSSLQRLLTSVLEEEEQTLQEQELQTRLRLQKAKLLYRTQQSSFFAQQKQKKKLLIDTQQNSSKTLNSQDSNNNNNTKSNSKASKKQMTKQQKKQQALLSVSMPALPLVHMPDDESILSPLPTSSQTKKNKEKSKQTNAQHIVLPPIPTTKHPSQVVKSTANKGKEGDHMNLLRMDSATTLMTLDDSITTNSGLLAPATATIGLRAGSSSFLSK